jgi:hypothetical protein
MWACGGVVMWFLEGDGSIFTLVVVSRGCAMWCNIPFCFSFSFVCIMYVRGLGSLISTLGRRIRGMRSLFLVVVVSLLGGLLYIKENRQWIERPN